MGPPERGVADAVPRALSLLGGWDTTWYLDIAANGYDTFTPLVGVFFTNFAFFPLLPGLMAAASTVGLNPFAAALVVSNLAFLAALAGLHRLTVPRMGARGADLTVWVLALAPVAVYASMAYTEAVVLALAVAAALAAVRGRWWLAGLLAAPAALARPPGSWWRYWWWRSPCPPRGPPHPVRAGGGRRPAGRGAPGGLPGVDAGRARVLAPPADAQEAWDRGPLVIGLFTNLPGELWAGAERLVTLDVGASWTAAIRDVGFSIVYVLLLLRLRRMAGSWRDPWVAFSALWPGPAVLQRQLHVHGPVRAAGLPAGVGGGRLLQEAGPGRRRTALLVAVGVTVLLVAQLAIRSP